MRGSWLFTQIFPTEGDVHGITEDNEGFFYYTTNYHFIYKTKKDFSKQELVIYIENAKLCGIVWLDNVLYVIDRKNHRILSYSLHKEILSTFAGSECKGYKDGPLDKSRFCWLGDIAKDKNGDLYCTDDHRIRKISLSTKTVSTIAGSESSGNQDGTLQEAKFKRPFGIAIDGYNTIYVLDSGNFSIRQVKEDVVSTIARQRPSHVTSVRDKEKYRPGSLCIGPNGSLMTIRSRTLRIIDTADNLIASFRFKNRVFTSMYVDAKGTCYVGSNCGMYVMESTWKWERILWIGNIKEGSDCSLVWLPRDIMRVIATMCFAEHQKDVRMQLKLIS